MKLKVSYTLTLLVILGMLLAACQPAAPAAEPAAGGEQAAAAGGEAAAPADVKDVPREKTYVVTLWSDTGGTMPGFDNWNPLMNAGGALRGNGGNAGLSEGLFYRNLNNGEETPWLGESYAPNEDFTQWTIKLRQGVEWSDGQPFSCTDVKFTIDLIKANVPDM